TSNMSTSFMPARGHSTSLKFNPKQPRELRKYFEELEFLFLTCGITDQDLKKKHTCRYVDIDSCELWESLPEYQPGTSFNAFRIAVHKFYPRSEDECKYSILDMDTLIREQLHISIFDSNDLGVYYRSFYNITNFLHSKHRILEAEQSRAFVRGFQTDLRTQIVHRLEVKFPDHYPDDPYALNDIHDAAKFVIACSNSYSIPQQSISTSNSSQSSTSINSEDMLRIFEHFASNFASVVTASHLTRIASEISVPTLFITDIAPSTPSNQTFDVTHHSMHISDNIEAHIALLEWELALEKELGLEREIFALRNCHVAPPSLHRIVPASSHMSTPVSSSINSPLPIVPIVSALTVST
ncbi:hypothetical protein L208DRAFT_1489604, partial [Tricholoma matsutake]